MPQPRENRKLLRRPVRTNLPWALHAHGIGRGGMKNLGGTANFNLGDGAANTSGAPGMTITAESQGSSPEDLFSRWRRRWMKRTGVPTKSNLARSWFSRKRR